MNSPYVEGITTALELKASHAELLKALRRAYKLVQLLTIQQIIQGGDEVIEAAGLNPWAINEGLAMGKEHFNSLVMEAAIAKAETFYPRG